MHICIHFWFAISPHHRYTFVMGLRLYFACYINNTETVATIKFLYHVDLIFAVEDAIYTCCYFRISAYLIYALNTEILSDRHFDLINTQYQICQVSYHMRPTVNITAKPSVSHQPGNTNNVIQQSTGWEWWYLKTTIIIKNKTTHIDITSKNDISHEYIH